MAAGVEESASGCVEACFGLLWLSSEDEDCGDPSLVEGSAVIKTSDGVGVADSHSSPLTLISRSCRGREG